MIKELFKVMVSATLQLLQLYFSLHVTGHTQGIELSRHVIDFKYKGVVCQAIIYSYHTVNHHLKTNLNDRSYAKQYFVSNSFY